MKQYPVYKNNRRTFEKAVLFLGVLLGFYCAKAFPVLPSSQLLYVVTDKTLYTPGEVVWFSAYLLNNGKQTDTLQPDIISVALVPMGDTVGAIRKNYYMQGGLCAGSLTLPDSITAGSYNLVACSNVLDSSGMPVHDFRKPLTIKSLEQEPYNLHFQFEKEVRKDSLQLTLQLSFPDAAILAGKHKHDQFSYWLNESKPHTAKLGATGHLFFSIAWKDIATSNHTLYTSTTYKGITKTFNLLLPHAPTEKVQVGFYPEYGKLMAGKKQKILWQCHYTDNAPAVKKALLLKNNTVIDTLQTDSSGIGSFILIPKVSANYSLRIINKDTKAPQMNFPLPKPVDKGWLMTATNSFTKDTLRMKATGNTSTIFRWAIKDKDSTRPLTAFMKADSAKSIKLLLNDMDKGIHILALQDSTGKTIAQRPFFAHYGNDSNVSMKVNKSQFTTREKVSIDITLKGVDSALPGVYTIYCVQTSRIEPKLQRTMESYYYTYPFTKGDISLLSYRSEYWLQNRLLLLNSDNNQKNVLYTHNRSLHKPIIQGKVLFAEEGIMRKYARTGKVDPVAVNPGMVTPINRPVGWLMDDETNLPEPKLSNKKITDSLQVIIKRAGSWNFLPVNNAIFHPTAEALAIPEDSSLFAMATPIKKKANATHYAVQTDDPMQLPAKLAIQQPYLYTFPLQIQSNTETYLNDIALGNMLNTVTVKSRNAGIVEDAKYMNPCGDYVCAYGILDCPEHPPGSPGNFQPIKGHRYRIIRPTYIKTIIYQGCTTNNVVGIYISRKFHGMDSTRLASNNKTLLSTIFWKPFTFVQAGTKKHIQFYTGDLQGSFKLIAEGIDANGQIFYKEKTITLKEN